MTRAKTAKHRVTTKASTVHKKRIVNSKIPWLRDRLAKKQGGICPICERRLSRLQLTLDHCHKTGYVRGTLCRNCNGLIGKIAGLLTRLDVAKIGTEQILINMGLWHQPDNLKKKWIHPNAETLLEQKQRQKKRAALLYKLRKKR